MNADQNMRTAVGVMTINRNRPTVDTAISDAGRLQVTAGPIHLNVHGVMISLHHAEEMVTEVEGTIVVEEAACPRGIMPREDREQTHRHGVVVDVAFRDMIISMIVRLLTRTVELVVRKDIFSVYVVIRREFRLIGTDGLHVPLE